MAATLLCLAGARTKAELVESAEHLLTRTEPWPLNGLRLVQGLHEANYIKIERKCYLLSVSGVAFRGNM